MMKEILGMAVKFVLSILAGAYFISNTGVMYGIVCGGICYGLLSYIQWFISKSGKTIGSLLLSILAAIVVLSLFTLGMNTILPDGIGAQIAAFLVIIMCIGFLIKDVKTIIQLLKKNTEEGEER